MFRAASPLGAVVIVSLLGVQPQPRGVAPLTVDFAVTTQDGRHASGLTAAEVSLKVGGTERTIRRLEEVDVEPPAASAAAPSSTSALPPPYGETLRAADRPGRSIMLVVDEGTLFGMEEVLRDAVAKLVASLSPADRLGVTSTRPDGINVPLTTRHQTVRAAVDAIALGRGNAFLCVGGVTRQVLSLAQLLPPGRASTLAFLSRGGGVANPQGPGAVIGSGECIIRPDQLRPIADAISSTQINYHAFHIGAAGISGTLDNFAGATGAESTVLSFADATALTKIIQSAARFYRATIDADPNGGDRLERVELRVHRTGVRVKGPTHLSLEPAKLPTVDAAELLRGEARRGDLPMRVSAFASKNEGPRPAKLLVVVEPAEPDTKLAEAIISLLASTGQVAGQWTARPADLAKLPLMAALPVMPGAYRVRVAAVDERGRAGIAEYNAETLQGVGDVKLSGLVLGVSPNGEFTPKLLFRDEATAVAYLEIYNARPTANVDVTLELAATADAPPTRKIQAQISAGQTQTAIAQIPLSSLPQGDTIVRAIVTVDGMPAGQTARTLRKSLR
jgi:hypothetical protein